MKKETYKFVANNSISDLATVADTFHVKASAIFNECTANARRAYTKSRSKAIRSLDKASEACRFAKFEAIFGKLRPVTGADEIAVFKVSDLNLCAREVARRNEERASRKRERDEEKRIAESRANARSESKRKLVDAIERLTGSGANAVKTAFAELESI